MTIKTMPTINSLSVTLLLYSVTQDYKSFSMLIGGASLTTKVDNLPKYTLQ